MEYSKIIILLAYLCLSACQNRMRPRVHRIINYASAVNDKAFVERWYDPIGINRTTFFYEKDSLVDSLKKGIGKNQSYTSLIDCKAVRVFKYRKGHPRTHFEKTWHHHLDSLGTKALICKESFFRQPKDRLVTTYTQWYLNGQKAYEETDVWGEKIESQKWNKNGQLIAQYTKGFIPSDSTRPRGSGYYAFDGEQLAWDENGDLRYRVLCKDGWVILYEPYSEGVRLFGFTYPLSQKKNIYKLGMEPFSFKTDYSSCSQICFPPQAEGIEPEPVPESRKE